MKVLIACEFSGIVRDAFRNKGVSMSKDNGPIFQDWKNWSNRIVDDFEIFRKQTIPKKINQETIERWI